MDMVFVAVMGGIFLLDGLLMAFLEWVAVGSRWAQFRIQPVQPNRIEPGRRRMALLANNALAFVAISGPLWLLGDTLLYARWPGLATWLGESLLVLMCYDCAYYFYHRTLHHPRLMRYVHGVHHFVRFPTAALSNYLHPLEQLGALTILFTSAWLVGPISQWSFLMLFGVYSVVNIIVHSNLVLPHPAFRLFNFWVQRHDIHHRQVKHNYASIFPFWDQAFGTYK